MNDLETEIEPESIFATAIRHLPPAAIGSRAILEVMTFFAPFEPLSPKTVTVDGEHIPNAAVYSALFAVRGVLGAIHPASQQLERDLREALR